MGHNSPEKIIILLLDGFSALCLANTVEPLRAANTTAGRMLYRYQLASIDGSGVRSSSGLQVGVDGPLTDTDHCDLLFVVSSYDFDRAPSRTFNTVVQRAAGRAVRLGGLDTGAWLLARLGLLDGYRASIHWQEMERMAEDFPDVQVSAERYVADRDRITAGGATAVMDLMLSLIRERHGDALAIDVMRLFLYDREIGPGTVQRGLLATPQIARHPELARAIQAMEEAIETPRALPDIAERAGVSQRQLARRFSTVFGQTPQAYYLGLRLTAARRLASETNMRLAEVATRTGFTSAAAFARAFRQRFGVPPRKLRAARYAPTPIDAANS